MSDHLTPATMAEAQRRLVAKAIAEFAHERLLTPEPTHLESGQAGWRVTAGASAYDFTARVHALEHWVIDARSLTRTVLGEAAPLDAQELIVECSDRLGIPASLLPTYLEEIASTLASSAWKLVHHTQWSAELVHADYQEIEAAMSEGHPAFVANNGRIGFSADDFAAYAPETGSDVRLLWVAVRRSEAHLSLARDLDEHDHYVAELGAEAVAAFEGRLERLGLDPADYLYLPVHPWQWTHRLAITFAPDVARRSLVLLGEGPGAHRAQQSIRTFFPIEHPTRSYVKVALAIQNMGFVRGLSPAYMAATPAINDWVADVVSADETLAGCGFSVLREHAAIGWTGDVFHRLADSSPYRKMIAALWRESPMDRLAPGERLATMASLLHRDRGGAALATELVRASGLSPEEWVATYLRAYLRPLVHCLLAYDLAFMPHGENLVMVLDGHVPTRMLMKDIGEEVAVMGDLPLPAEVERIRADVPLDVRALAIHTDVFDGFLRYLAAILDEDGVLPSATFWQLVADCVLDHERDHPELAESAAAYDLMRPTFRHSCLNRLQLRNTSEMVDLTDQAESLIFAGELANPIAAPEVEEGRRLVTKPVAV
jgi:siderophore synthetase component